MDVPGYSVAGSIDVGPEASLARGRADDGAAVLILSPALGQPPIKRRALCLAARDHSRTAGRDIALPVRTLTEGTSNPALILEDPGGKLFSEMLGKGGLRTGTLLEHALALARLTERLHGRGLMHCDIRPGSVLSRPDGQAVFMALHHATPMRQGVTTGAVPSANLAYAAPELSGRIDVGLDERSDLYSIGVTLFELAAARLPFQQEDPSELAHAHVALPAPDLESIRADLPRPFCAIVDKLLSKDPEDRYATAYGLAYDISRALTQYRRTGAVRMFALGEKDRSARFRLPDRIYGRDEEREALLHAFTQGTMAGKRQFVTVHGPSGIGKTAFVNQMRLPLARAGAQFHAGKFDQFRRDQPYLGLISVARSLLHSELGQPREIRQKRSAELQEAVGRYGALLTELIPELAVMIGPQPPVEDIPPIEAARRFNLLILRYLRAFVSPERPVLIFVDDVQWADPASLALLEMMGQGAGLEHLMFVLGYRTNEIGPGHPATSTLAVMRDAAENHLELALAPLGETELRRLLADTLDRNAYDVSTLATHLYQASAGNAFFAREYITALHDRGFLKFDSQTGRWMFNLREIRTGDVPDNVAVFLTERLDTLPEHALDLLDTASCVGSEFDLATLGRIYEISQVRVAGGLKRAVDAGIVVPLGAEHSVFSALSTAETEADASSPSEGTEDVLRTARYRFRHDQVRLAVHDRLDDESRADRHLKVGRLLMRDLDPGELASRSVEVFGHIAWGAHLLSDPDERLACARLGLQAGRAARAGLAFATAKTQLDLAEKLLPETPWETNYDIILSILTTQAECAFALGDVAELGRIEKVVSAKVKDPVDAAAVAGMRMRYLATEERYDDATDICVAMARALGVAVPRRPNMAHVLAGVVSALRAQGRQDVKSFADLPETNDRRIRTAVTFLTHGSGTAYFSESNLLPLIGIIGTKLTLRHGLSPSAPYAFAVWGLVLCGALGMIKRGAEFGELAIELGQRYRGVEESRARFVVNTFVRHWTQPLSTVVDPLIEAWNQNRDGGDEENATYSAGVMLYVSFLSGRAADADLLAEGLPEYIAGTNMPHVKSCFMAWVQFHEILRGDSLPVALEGPRYSHAEMLPGFKAMENGVQIAISSIAAGTLDFLAGRYEAAMDHYDLAARYEENIVGQVLVPGLAFFRAMTAQRLAISRRGDKRLRRIARAQTRRIKAWAKHSPENMNHRLHLLDAERAVASNDTGAAMLSLSKAMEAAGPNAPLYQGIAQARLAELLEDDGQAAEAGIARARAIELFEAWGSPAVATFLREKGKSAPIPVVTAQQFTQGADALDLREFLSSIGAVAADMDLPALQAALVQAIMRAANADRAVLVVANDDASPIAELEMVTGAEAVRLDQPLEGLTTVAHTALDLSLNAAQKVVANSAVKDPLLATDAHIQAAAPRAVMSLPLSVQGRVIGALYLEHRRSSTVFTPARVEIAEAFATQAAVALENARLYSRVQTALKNQTLQTEANRRFVPEALLDSLGFQSITDVSLNRASESIMTAVFADLRGFTGISQSIGPQRTIEMINRYLSHVQPGIAAHGGFVGNYMGDGLLALFPGSPDRAIHGAQAMALGLQGYNRERGDLPELRFGIGVETGPVILGMIGDPDHIQCGVLGDAVNTASRVEGLSKIYGAQIIVAGNTLAAISDTDTILFRPLGKVTVAGKEDPIEIFEYLGGLDEAELRPRIAARADYDAALDAYRAGNFEIASRGFHAASRAAGGDPVADALARRAEELRVAPPKDWDGVDHYLKDAS